MIDRNFFKILKIKVEKITGNIIKHMILIGNSKNNGNKLDFDIVIVIDDSVNVFGTLNKLSPFLAKYSIVNQKFISCFLIKEMDYKRESSQFIKNIKHFGNVLE